MKSVVYPTESDLSESGLGSFVIGAVIVLLAVLGGAAYLLYNGL